MGGDGVSFSCNSLDSQTYPFQRGNYVFIMAKTMERAGVWINSGFGQLIKGVLKP